MSNQNVRRGEEIRIGLRNYLYNIPRDDEVSLYVKKFKKNTVTSRKLLEIGETRGLLRRKYQIC